jgi:hypothetical protein
MCGFFSIAGIPLHGVVSRSAANGKQKTSSRFKAEDVYQIHL